MARFEVTLKRAKRSWKGVPMSDRTCKRVIKEAKLKWGRSKAAPRLSKKDKQLREQFAAKWMEKKVDHWDRTLALDGKW